MTADVLDFALNSGLTRVQAGAAVTQFDLLEAGPDERVWPCAVTDYAAVADFGSFIIANTTIANGGYNGPDFPLAAPIVVAGANNDIYVAHSNIATHEGVSISRYTAAGELIAVVILDPSVTTMYNLQLLVLSNGDLLITYNNTSAWFVIVDPFLAVVQAVTSIGETVGASQNVVYIALSGGGFMATYLKNATATQRIAVWSNAGAVVTAPTTIKTWTGTPGTIKALLIELDTLNVAAVFQSEFTGTPGLFYGTFGPTGTNVLPIANIDTGAVSGTIIAVDKMAGFFAISKADGTNAKTRVYSDAGALQGGAFTFATTKTAVALANDGTYFYATSVLSVGTSVEVARIPTTGSSFTQVNLGTLSSADAVSPRAACEHGLMVLLFDSGSWEFAVVNLAHLYLEADFTTTGVTAGSSGALILAGDFSFLMASSEVATAMNFLAMKYADTAIVGVAGGDAAADAFLYQRSTNNIYATNPLKGSQAVKFNHAATNIPGNGGLVGTNGVTLTGI